MPTPIPLSRDIQDFRVGTLTYNGVTFPPGRKMKGEYTPVMDDANRATKYIKGHISVSCVLFPGSLGTAVTIDGRNALPYYEAQYVGNVGTSTDYTTDGELATIRQRLLEPCQHLVIADQGFGTIDLNSPSGKVRDVDNGPKPSIAKWTPYTNKAALVEWKVDFCYSPCTFVTGGFPTGLRVCQWPFEVEISINDRSLITRTITGRVEVAMTRVPTTGSIAAGPETFDMLTMEQQILSIYPRLTQFKRVKETFKMTKDRKFMEFTIVDEEIDSMEAYGEGIANEDVTLRTSSGFKDGFFSKWMTTLDGTIEVYPGWGKTYGIAEAARLFNRYCASVCNKGFVSLNTVTDPDPTKSPPSGSTQSYAILRDIKYIDHIFERKMGFSYTWELFCSPEYLFAATGMFLPIESTNAAVNKTWQRWMADGNRIDSGGFQQLTFSESKDIIVSLCDWQGPKPTPGSQYRYPPPTKPKPPERPKQPTRKENQDQYGTGLKDRTAFYSTFKNEFHITQSNKGIPHIPLLSTGIIQESAKTYDFMNYTVSTQLPKSQQSSVNPNDRVLPLVHKYGPTTTTITSVGYAERLGAPPQIMEVESMGGLKAVSIGTDEYLPIHLGYGIDMQSGNNYSIHGLAWKKQYIVIGEPEQLRITSTGHPSAFTV